jgi:hypothetical protein
MALKFYMMVVASVVFLVDSHRIFVTMLVKPTYSILRLLSDEFLITCEFNPCRKLVFV